MDATTTPPLGDPRLVKDCSKNEKREIRLVGKGQGVQGARLYITCSE